MIHSAPLPRHQQLRLNARAMLRDLATGRFAKLRFHWRGLSRALFAA